MKISNLNIFSSLANIQEQLSILIKGEKLSKENFKDFCQIKRFHERWTADKKFRDSFSLNPVEALNLYGIKICPDDVRPLWDNCFLPDASNNRKHIYFDVLLGDYLRTRKDLDEDKTIDNVKFKSWRDRQINRCNSQFHPQHSGAIGHYPVCFELSKGCSVGCWFCGISAPKLGDIFLHDENNSILWKEILGLLKRYIGEDVSSGFCYWASDPLDNPDYEKFCVDFHDVLGRFPSTSTAQANKYPERVRQLIHLSIKKGRRINRFSILSIKMLNQIHNQFSAEELATVELVFQNPESLSGKAIVGKASEISTDSKESAQSTIACVTGFLFNMVDSSVKLISPCPASEEFPDGYITFAEGNFSNILELENLIEKMLSSQSINDTIDGNYIGFRSDLEYKDLSNGFQVSTKFMTYKFDNYPYIQSLGNILGKKSMSYNSIVLAMEDIGLPEVDTLYLLSKFFDKGIIENFKIEKEFFQEK